MATRGHVQADYEISIQSLKRCPLCGRASALVLSERADSRICPTCGLNFEQLEGICEKSAVRAIAKPRSSTNDPIDRWLSGEPIQQTRLNEWQRASLWARQHPRMLGTMGAALLLMLSLTLGSLLAYLHASHVLQTVSTERDAVATERLGLVAAVAQKTDEIQKQEARWQEQLREQQSLEQNLNKLQASYQQNQQESLAADQRLKDAVRAARLEIAKDFGRQAEQLHHELPDVSLFLAAKALGITQEDGAPPIQTAVVQMEGLLAPTGGAELHGHDSPIVQLATSRDGNWLASGDDQGWIRLWPTTSISDTKTSKLLDGHWGRVTQLVFTADNRWLVTGGSDSAVHIWNLARIDADKKPVVLKNKQGRLSSLAVSDDGRWLSIGVTSYVTNDVVVRLCDLRADDIVASIVDLPSYQGELRSLAVSRTGNCVATGNKDGVVRFWRLSGSSRDDTWTNLHVPGEHVGAIRFAADGRSLITAGDNESVPGTVRAWDLDGPAAADDIVLAGSPRGVEQFTLTADGRWLFTADQTSSLRVRDLTVLDQQKSSTLLAGQTCAVQAMSLSANERWFAAAGSDNTVRLWYVAASGPWVTPITIRPSRGVITSVSFVRQGDWLATGNDRGNIQFWNLQLDELVRTANAQIVRK
jgi:WD40 repeat protein